MALKFRCLKLLRGITSKSVSPVDECIIMPTYGSNISETIRSYLTDKTVYGFMSASRGETILSVSSTTSSSKYTVVRVYGII